MVVKTRVSTRAINTTKGLDTKPITRQRVITVTVRAATDCSRKISFLKLKTKERTEGSNEVRKKKRKKKAGESQMERKDSQQLREAAGWSNLYIYGRPGGRRDSAR